MTKEEMMITNSASKVYITRAGDTFDLLALAAYNDEKMASYIIEANPLHGGTLIFDAGVSLKIPEIQSKKVPSSLPPWRK